MVLGHETQREEKALGHCPLRWDERENEDKFKEEAEKNSLGLWPQWRGIPPAPFGNFLLKLIV